MNCARLISPEANANSRCLTAPEPADVAVDRHVVGRIGEDEVGPRPVHQRLEVDLAARVAAQQAMAAEPPEIAVARDRRAGCEGNCIVRPIGTVGIRLARLVDDEVDLGQAEAGQLDVEVEVDQRLQLDREDLLVPAGIERELVVGEHVGPPLGLG